MEQFVAILLDMKFEYDVPMLEADFVDLEQGTGIVIVHRATDLTILICVLKTILNPAIPLIVLDYTLKKYLIFLKLIFLKQTYL